MCKVILRSWGGSGWTVRIGILPSFIKVYEYSDSMKDVLCNVYQAPEKGYSPVGQIVGYLLSGDPAFITSYKNARTMILSLNQVLEEMLKSYLEKCEVVHSLREFS